MLRRLTIRDFVLAHRLELDFSEGFGALTGETGAGKSILLDALSLLLGSRADPAMIREGGERAEISGVFEPAADSPVASWLAANDFAVEDELIVRRVLESSGRSRAQINGSPATGAQLKELGEFLADIHGQHAHHALLRADSQRQMLDAQAGATELSREVALHFREWAGARRAHAEALADQAELTREREMLEWQLGEAKSLAFDLPGWESLNAEHQRLGHAASLIDGAAEALATLDDDEPALSASLDHVLARLTELSRFDGQLAPVVDLLSGAAIGLGEAVSALRRYRDRIEADPEALEAAERRIAAVTQFARKYRLTVEEIPERIGEWSERLGLIEQASDLAALEKAEQAAQSRYREAAERLSVLRQRAASEFSKDVSDAMQSLAMAGGVFDVALSPLREASAQGLESVEFLVAANPNQTPRPLAKVASGGELSRIGLAIQVIASRSGTAPTLIFDEVDVGIGGRVAEIVGRHLAALGRERQVLVVTHLPQVAARADWQWQVSKSLGPDGAVRSELARLEGEARVEEIARMLGGVDITETTRAHAAELLAAR
ncbi:DNA repair protein RecN [Niveibacterium terrae]|uniref:DNA repair protein RecN n=1 Tax=Niveibacterium terrae TaxID=3373598 RepID=UPI003A958F8B